MEQLRRLSRRSLPRGRIGHAFGQIGPLSKTAQPPPLTTAAGRAAPWHRRLAAYTWHPQTGAHLAAVRRAARRRPPGRCRRRLAAGLWRRGGGRRGWPVAPRGHLAADLLVVRRMLATRRQGRPHRRPAKDACGKETLIACGLIAPGCQFLDTSPPRATEERGGVGWPHDARNSKKVRGEADAGAPRATRNARLQARNARDSCRVENRRLQPGSAWLLRSHETADPIT